MNRWFEEIKKNFGFGVMRLPQTNGKVDTVAFSEMVDCFLDAGFNYFDTAHGYLDGESEIAIRESLVKRHPRESFVLTDKLTDNYFNKREDILPVFEQQLAACGVEWFDFYFMHSQDARLYKKFVSCGAYEVARELKRQGRVHHIGISFHDKAEVLDKILSEQPDIEVVQIQLNYMDYDDAIIESRECYETCCAHGKPVVVMEPCKGGMLTRLPDAAAACLAALGGGSPASYAIRFAASFDGVMMVLSGMSDIAQVRENVGYMADFKPLSAEERAAVEEARSIFRSEAADMIACTDCHYCMAGCPKHIAIPYLFSCYNSKLRYAGYEDFTSDWYYSVHTQGAGKASDCEKCGKCEKTCPQHLPIRRLLEKVAATFETQRS